MRVKLGSDSNTFQVLKTLYKILQNIIENPFDPKYQKLRLSNPKIKAAITDVEQSKSLLEIIGFDTFQLEVQNPNMVMSTGKPVLEPHLVLV